jgi:hypothetical protein
MDNDKTMLTVSLPGNVMTLGPVIAEVAPSSNGGGLLIWVRRGQVNSNTDKLKFGLVET